MNSPRFGLRVAAVIFGLVCCAHLVRLLLRFQVMLGSHPMPVWMNGIGFVVSGFLAYWLWRLSGRAGAPPLPAKA